MARILVVEDDRQVRDALTRALGLEGHEVASAPDGLAGLERIRDEEWDAIVLDMMMPHMGGIDVCRRMRATADRTPVLMLTARHETADRVAGLDAGADDYLVKPFAVEELFARVRALLRRAAPDDPTRDLRVGSLHIDPAGRRVTRDGVEVILTKTEYELLVLLARHPDQVLTRDTIFEQIWGD
jgi:two-component system response regulator MprA